MLTLMEEKQKELASVLENIDAIPEVSIFAEAHEPLEELLSELDMIIPNILQSHSLPIYELPSSFSTSSSTQPHVSIGTLNILITESEWEGNTCYELRLFFTPSPDPSSSSSSSSSSLVPSFEVHSFISPQLITWYEHYHDTLYQNADQTIWYEPAASLEGMYLIHEPSKWVRCHSKLLFQGSAFLLACILLQNEATSRLPKIVKELFMYSTYLHHEPQLITMTLVPASFPKPVSEPWIGLHFDPPQLCQQWYVPKLPSSNASPCFFQMFGKYLVCETHRVGPLPSDSFQTILQKEKEAFGFEWESLLYDQKDKELAKTQTYLQTHPELTQLLTEWMKSVLTIKPENVFEHAKNYFDLS